MEKAWLEAQLQAGQSIEAIARALGRHPSTVAYWALKHGLTSHHASRHAPRGGIDRDLLAQLVDEGLSIRAIAARLELSAATVRHWLRRHALQTHRAQRLSAPAASPQEPALTCPVHGTVAHVRGSDGYLRCRRCRAEAVVRRRGRVRALLIAEAGGRCAACGYDVHPGALQFHHVDPATKAFTLRDGETRSLARMREEARKCVLLCANCHAEVEGGVTDLLVTSDHERGPEA
jgi:transposase